jgi:uncharacterized protein with GYD domain
MIFITLSKWRGKQTKEGIARSNKLWEKMVKEGTKILGQYWTLGRYDSVAIIEAKDEKAAMKFLMLWGDSIASETLVAVPREEAVKLVE